MLDLSAPGPPATGPKTTHTLSQDQAAGPGTGGAPPPEGTGGASNSNPSGFSFSGLGENGGTDEQLESMFTGFFDLDGADFTSSMVDFGEIGA